MRLVQSCKWTTSLILLAKDEGGGNKYERDGDNGNECERDGEGEMGMNVMNEYKERIGRGRSGEI